MVLNNMIEGAGDLYRLTHIVRIVGEAALGDAEGNASADWIREAVRAASVNGT
jgi:hypothetical protein